VREKAAFLFSLNEGNDFAPSQCPLRARQWRFRPLSWRETEPDRPVRWTPLLEQGESEKIPGGLGTASPRGCVTTGCVEFAAPGRLENGVAKDRNFQFPAYRPWGKRKRERLVFCRLSEGRAPTCASETKSCHTRFSFDIQGVD